MCIVHEHRGGNGAPVHVKHQRTFSPQTIRDPTPGPSSRPLHVLAADMKRENIEEWVGMLEMNSAGFQDYDPDDEGEVSALVLKNDGSERSVSELLASAESLLGLSK